MCAFVRASRALLHRSSTFRTVACFGSVQVVQQAVPRLLDECFEENIHERVIPEAADVDAQALRRLQDLPQRPHQHAVDAHELLRRDRVRLVVDDRLFSECFLTASILS